MVRSVVKHPVTGEELWTTTRAAEYLGVSRSTLVRHLDEWGLQFTRRHERSRRMLSSSSVKEAVSRVWPESEVGAEPTSE